MFSGEQPRTSHLPTCPPTHTHTQGHVIFQVRERHQKSITGQKRKYQEEHGCWDRKPCLLQGFQPGSEQEAGRTPSGPGDILATVCCSHQSSSQKSRKCPRRNRRFQPYCKASAFCLFSAHTSSSGGVQRDEYRLAGCSKCGSPGRESIS